jgi:hypothetical protein
MDAQIGSKEAEVAAQVQETQSVEEASAESVYTQTQDSSNEFGDSIIKKAKKYLGDSEANGRYKKFSTGDYGWCADYVTYVVMKVCKEKGMSDKELKEVRKHLGASPYKLRTRNSKNYYNTKKMSKAERKEFTQNTLKPGMAFICKGGGASGEHTGFVAEVYDDGTFLSIEGNCGNAVKQVRRKISDMYGFVDFSYLYS